MSKKQFKVAITFTLTEDVIVNCLENEDPEAMAKLQILNGEIPLRSHKCRDLKTLCIDGPEGDSRCLAFKRGSDFSWALRQMKVGKKVRRNGWKSLFCSLINGDLVRTSKSSAGCKEVQYFRPHCLDITADNWELCENVG